MGQGTLVEFRDELEDPPRGLGWVGDFWGGPGRIEGPSQRLGTGWVTFGEARNGSIEPRGSLGWVGGPSGRSETGRGTLPEVRDG